jgi:uncharacterized protein
MISIAIARKHYDEHDAAHDFDHVLRVWALAQRLGAAEGADMAILQAAALLHDVGRPEQSRTGRCHAEVGSERARVILAGHPAAQVEAVAQAIAEHRFRSDRRPTSVEARVLYDADKLDALGAVGVARAFAAGGVRGQRIWAPVSPEYAARSPLEGRDDLDSEEHTPVHEYMFKLAKLPERMCTAAGRALAIERREVMAAFYTRLEQEIKGEQ